MSDKNGCMNRVAVIGGLNADIWGRPSGPVILRDSSPGSVTLTPGGVGRNIAHDLCLLGLDVSLISAVGGDPNGEFLLRSCRSLGMDVSHILVVPGARSSSYLYITDECGDMQLAVNDMDICGEISPAYLETILPGIKAGALVLDTNIPASSLEFVCRTSSMPLYADPVSSVKAMKLLPVMKYIRAIKPNALEAAALTGQSDPELAAAALIAMGAGRVFVSLGTNGMIAAEGSRVLRLPSPEASVVNTTGAGDAAMSAIVWADMHGLSLEDSARAAQLAGAITCANEAANAPELSRLPDLLGAK